MSRRRSHQPALRRIGAGATALLLALGALPLPAAAVTPTDGPPLTLNPVTINDDGGDQYDPHVSGDVASYTSNNNIRYYNFSLGSDDQVPAPLDAIDHLSDVSNGRIAFARDEATGRSPILVFDTVPPTTTEVDPQPLEPFLIRSQPAIGANTVAFIDYRAAGGPQGELFASDLGGSTQRVTTDTRIDQHPSVSPLGDRIVWESCESSSNSCDIHEATLMSGTWTLTPLMTTGEPEANPDTDGVTVVYDATRSGERDIRWQPVGGGTEGVLDLVGEQRNPSISFGVVLYESVAGDDSAADLWVYEIATNRRFRITTTQGLDENLNDISSLDGVTFRIVWSSGPAGDRDVFGATFTIPAVPTLSIDDVTQLEGNAGTTTFTFTVSRAGSTLLPAAVAYATANDTATGDPGCGPPGVDYFSESGTLTFLPTETTQQITIVVCGDTVLEPDETFFVNLSSPVGATISDGQGVGTIQNDDSANKILFMSTRDDYHFDIYSMNEDGGGPTRLAFNSSGFDGLAVWSPDRSKIAFVSTRDGNFEIYTVNAEGTPVVVRRTLSNKFDLSPSWSPDGTHLAFSSNRDGDFDIYTIDVTLPGVDPNPIKRTNNNKTDITPAWSPTDMTKIAFSSDYLGNSGSFDIFTMIVPDPDLAGYGSTRTNLTNNPKTDVFPAWSPLGANIAFSSDDGHPNNFEIYTMNANGTGRTRLTTNGRIDTTPVYSADGTTIWFSSNRMPANNFEIYSMASTGGPNNPATNLTNHPAFDTLPN